MEKRIRLQHTIRNVALSVPLVLITCSSAAQQASTEPALASLANQIETLVVPQAEAELVSGIILVAKGNQILFQRAYGFANWELRVANSPSTRFGIASITKPMTETLVHVLANAGRIDLDAPVERYLPGFPRGPDGGMPTVHHLLAHRAGGSVMCFRRDSAGTVEAIISIGGGGQETVLPKSGGR